MPFVTRIQNVFETHAGGPFMTHARQRRVALLIESSRGYGRDILRGIARFAHEQGSWSIIYQERTLNDPPPPWLRRQKLDGVIARIETPIQARALQSLGVPVVDVRGVLPGLGMPTINGDDAQVAHMAGEHLQECGFKHLAFCGFEGVEYSDRRAVAFSVFCRQRGLPCHVYHPPQTTHRTLTTEYEADGLNYEEHVAQWLKALPKPAGLMACNDIRGQQVLYACRDAGIAVPDEVAVIGVDNDDMLCDLCDPSLSSVAQNAARVGYEAAAALERMMTGGHAPGAPVHIPPLGVVARRSTDVLALGDRQIAHAVRFIREHACEGLDVSDVVQEIHMSRTLLERRFRKWVGHSPKAEILRVQMQRAKKLLAETDLTIAEIAGKVGHRHVEYFNVAFKRLAGQPPGRFRRASAGR